MMKKWNLIVDVSLCTNCANCFLAVKDEYCSNTFPGYSEAQPLHGHYWIDIKRRERGAGSLMDVAYLPTTCNQCDNAPCIKASQNDAIYKREDGIVMIDPDKSIGQKQLVKACPYGNIWWNEALELPQKWCFDAHLLDNSWKEPRVTKVCATGALKAVLITDEDMKKMCEREQLEALRPELNSMPHVWYKNMYRFRDEFISGSIICSKNGQTDCVADAQVTLVKNSESLKTLKTDFFGDFKFDGLPTDSGVYEVKITVDGFAEKTIKVDLSRSINLGPISIFGD
jgi:Fe-S-cluster-containing dehydrogenase component